LSRGSNPCGYPHKPLVSYRINRQLSGWILPPLMIRAFGAHCQQRTNAPQQKSPHSIIGRQFPNHEVAFLCIVRQDGFLAVKYLTGLGRLHAQSTFL
jgi:hypothetical protein